MRTRLYREDVAVCASKRAFSTAAEAHRFLRTIRDRGYPKQRPYECPNCHKFHLTTRELMSPGKGKKHG